MDTARWQRLRELFERALQLEDEARRSFLEEACGEDKELKERLESLLREDEAASACEFMETPPVTEIAKITDMLVEPEEDWTAALIGTQVGQYQVKGIISSGGMGTVFEAEQETPRRTVALKVMNRGITSPSVLKRFEYESQILARLKHPGIAQVFEAGRQPMGGDGKGMLPYFVMEYIEKARRITDYVREEGLSIRERVRLFLQACRAVQHGNQKGIIHRDLKPGNILVDGSGQVKVIDFGVARVVESDLQLTTLHTEAGQIIGTLQYMSPEQCEGSPHDLDTRSDVYSLGVLLYKLLLERLPYDVRNTSMIEAARRIREVLPQRPSIVKRVLRGDLDTILLTALEKDRERRYQSVGALAEDLRRYLEGELILARPAGPITKIVKTVKRRPMLTVGVGMGLLSLLVFLLYVVLWSYPKILKEQARTAAALAEASDRAVEKARINLFLEEMLSAPHPFKEGRDVKVVDVLDEAAEKIGGAFPDQPGVEASLRDTIGWSYLKLGLSEEAEVHLRAALEIQKEIASPDELETLLLENRLSAVLMGRDQLEEAERLVRKSYDGLRSFLGADHPDTLRAMVNLGKILHVQNRLDEAESILAKALGMYRSVHGDENLFTLETLSQLAATKKMKGDLAGAEALFSEAFEKQQRILGKRHSNTLITMGSLAMLRSDQGDYQGAEVLFREAIEIRRELQGEDHPATLALMNNFTIPLFRQGKLAEAGEIQQELLRIRRASLGSRHRDTIATMLNLAITFMNLGRYDEAESIYQEALGYLRSQKEGKSYLYVSACINLGILLRQQGKLFESESLLREVIEDFEDLFGRKHKFIVYAKHSLAMALHELGRPSESEALNLEVLEVRRETLGEEHPDTLVTMNNLGLNYIDLDRQEEAEPLFKQVYEAYRSIWGGEYYDTLSVMNQWARVLNDLDRVPEARALLAEAVEIARRILEEDDELKGLIHTNYGMCLVKAEEFEEAEAQLLEGHGILEAFGQGTTNAQWAVEGLIRLYETWGKAEEEAAWREKLESGVAGEGE